MTYEEKSDAHVIADHEGAAENLPLGQHHAESNSHSDGVQLDHGVISSLADDSNGDNIQQDLPTNKNNDNNNDINKKREGKAAKQDLLTTNHNKTEGIQEKDKTKGQRSAAALSEQQRSSNCWDEGQVITAKPVTMQEIENEVRQRSIQGAVHATVHEITTDAKLPDCNNNGDDPTSGRRRKQKRPFLLGGLAMIILVGIGTGIAIVAQKRSEATNKSLNNDSDASDSDTPIASRSKENTVCAPLEIYFNQPFLFPPEVLINGNGLSDNNGDNKTDVDASSKHAFGGYESGSFVTTTERGEWYFAGKKPADVKLVMDFGRDTQLSAIYIWNYGLGHGNSGNDDGILGNNLKEFSLRFAAEADGPSGFGASSSSTSYNPRFETNRSAIPPGGPSHATDVSVIIPRQEFQFDHSVVARYVEMTLLSNYFDKCDPTTEGGDRVGLAEIRFFCGEQEALSKSISSHDSSALRTTALPTPSPQSNKRPICAPLNISFNLPYYFLPENLINGNGLPRDENNEPNVDANSRHRLGWVMDSFVTLAVPQGGDYFADKEYGDVKLTMDFGQDTQLSAIYIWNYALEHANYDNDDAIQGNNLKEFSLRFATEEDGPDGFGSSVSFNPTFETYRWLIPPGGPSHTCNTSAVPRGEYPFHQNVTARYVEMSLLDNYFDPDDPTTESGDRVGLGEIRFFCG